MVAHQVAIGGDATDGVSLRQQARGSQFVGDAPEVEMLHGPLGKVLSFGYLLGR